MNVLATTSQSLLLVNCITGDARVLHRGAGLYYGIAQIGSMYAVAARRRLVSSDVPRDDERGCILIFDRAFGSPQIVEAPFALRDIHQIAWFDDRLWVTCSFDDRIAIRTRAGWQQWVPQPLAPARVEHAERTNDRYHFNSFHVVDDDIALLAHNHGASDLHFFDRRTRAWRRSIPLGRHSHNVWLDGDAYVTCSSIEGRLVSTSGWTLETGGFPRGVCFDGEHRAVGISALSERGQRDFTSAAIALYDRSWRLRHYVHLEREGMVLDLLHYPDVAAIDGRAHASSCFPLLATLTDADLVGAQGSSADVSR
ncbi:MAG TPA: hypothetical protein VKV24_12160 [Casimicrobiaceae bacterium]|nr:hypothetical protein [Casimicrobiaceae bacterium]